MTAAKLIADINHADQQRMSDLWRLYESTMLRYSAKERRDIEAAFDARRRTIVRIAGTI